MRTSFGKELAKLRIEFNESQVETALRLGITQECLSRIENGLQKPNLNLLSKLLLSYNLTKADKDRFINAFIDSPHISVFTISNDNKLFASKIEMLGNLYLCFDSLNDSDLAKINRVLTSKIFVAQGVKYD